MRPRSLLRPSPFFHTHTHNYKHSGGDTNKKVAMFSYGIPLSPDGQIPGLVV